jgi:3-oxoacyl-[acyl-carrier-protein] synthase-3
MIEISHVTRCLGSLIQTNEDISADVGWSAQEIEEKTGIKQRYIALESESTESLALNAVSEIESHELLDLDLIISVTNTPSISFPAIANLVHSEFFTDKNIQTIGLNAGCSGFVDALDIVYKFFKAGGSKKALIVTSDTYQKFIPKSDRSIRTLFSDGACATLVKHNSCSLRLASSIYTSHPKTNDFLTMKKLENQDTIFMNGPHVLNFSLKVIKEISANLDLAQPTLIFAHQAGKIILSNLQKKVDTIHKLPINYQNYGNLVSSSIPNLLSEYMPIIKNFNNVLFSGFGVGLKHTSLLFHNDNFKQS